MKSAYFHVRPTYLSLRSYRYLLAVIIGLFAGCNRADGPHETPLAPGTMRMISIEPVAEGGNSLISNGSFVTWYAGLSAPMGFYAPEAGAGSTVLRDVRSGHLGTTGYTARQTWTQLDMETDPSSRFRTELELSPHTQYQLEVVASATEGMAAAISAIEEDSDSGPRIVARSIVTVRGEEPARYSGTFTTRKGGTVLLTSYAIADSTLPGSVTWSEWKLSSTSEPAPPASLVDQSARRLLVDQALDQVERQIGLYGGLDAWRESTSPNRKNAARILREEGAKGESILGYDNFVSSKSELAWFEQNTATASNTPGTAQKAILNAERLLDARGIQFVVVTFPDRIQLCFGQVYRPSATLPLNLAGHADLVRQLLLDDVLVLDPAPALWAMQSAEAPMYWRGDSATPSRTLHAIADQIAPVLWDLGLVVPETLRKSYALKVESIPLEQRLVVGLAPALREAIPKEVHAVQRISDTEGLLFQPAATSPVLVAGSLALQHQVRGASLAARLSMDLGFPVSVPGANVQDTEILAYLTSGNAPEVDAAQFVVFCVAEQSLTRSDWKEGTSGHP